jgi:hypothetical protein
MKKWLEELGDKRKRQRLSEHVRSFAKDARSAVTQSVTGALDRPMFFLHIEKCGGTAVDEAIRRAYRTLDVTTYENLIKLDSAAAYRASQALGRPTWEYREELARYYLERDNSRFVTGHFQVSEELVTDYKERFSFLTVLREPVAKFVSHYFFNRYKDDDHGRIEVGLAEYLETGRARDICTDYVQLLTGTGDAPAEDAHSAERLEHAKRTLDKFALVGVLEDLPSFVDDFEDRFGAGLDVMSRNRNPASREKRREELTPEVEERIREMNAPNIAIFEHAKMLASRD